jgi:CubicO group peptidase (beta-lactamase class C family)
MKGKKIICIILIVLIITVLGYTQYNPHEELHEYKDVVGYWKEYFFINDSKQEMALRKFSLIDGNITETIRYELSTQCRIWVNKGKKISYENGHLNLWDEFEGEINEDKNSFHLKYESKISGEVYDVLLVRIEDEETMEFIDQLEPCSGEYVYRIPEETGDGLTCADLDEVGMNKKRIVDVVHKITEGAYRDIHSVLIIKDGNLVLEEYFGANGQMHGPFITQIYRDRVHATASVTKSVTSVLIGIAMDHGYITDIHAPVDSFFEYDYTQNQVHIIHLLTMTAGLDWNESYVPYSDPTNDYTRMGKNDDPIAYVLKKPIVTKPGEQFVYNSGLSVVLGEILKRKTGVKAEAFAEQYLFGPLNISSYEWAAYPTGGVATGGGLALRPRDLAKVGQLFITNGTWDGTRIVSEEWIQESTSYTEKNQGEYAYHWWTKNFMINNHKIQSFYALGRGGIFLFVFPELDMVVVFTAQNFESDWAHTFFRMIEDILCAAAPEYAGFELNYVYGIVVAIIVIFVYKKSRAHQVKEPSKVSHNGVIKMRDYIIKRLLLVIPTLLGVSFIIFYVTYNLPGGPAELLLRLEQANISVEEVLQIKKALGLDKPWYIQYFYWLKTVVRGGFGTSVTTGMPIRTEIMTRIPNTLSYQVAALVLSTGIAIPAGITCAVKQHTRTDSYILMGALAGVSFPLFFTGLLLMYVSTLTLGSPFGE